MMQSRFVTDVIASFRVESESQIVIVWYKTGDETLMNMEELIQVYTYLQTFDQPSKKVPWNKIQINSAIFQAKRFHSLGKPTLKELISGLALC